MSNSKFYVAVVRREIRDEAELQLEIRGDMDPLEIEKQAEEMAMRLGVFDPGALVTRVKSSLMFLDLVEMKGKDSDKLSFV